MVEELVRQMWGKVSTGLRRDANEDFILDCVVS